MIHKSTTTKIFEYYQLVIIAAFITSLILNHRLLFAVVVLLAIFVGPYVINLVEYLVTSSDIEKIVKEQARFQDEHMYEFLSSGTPCWQREKSVMQSIVEWQDRLNG